VFLASARPFFDFLVVWDFNGSSSRPGEAMPTSPLLKGPTLQMSSLRHKFTCGTADVSDLDDEDNSPRQPSSTQVQCRRNVTAPTLFDSDDEAGTMIRPRPRTNRNNIVLSDDEVVKIDQLSTKSSKISKPTQQKQEGTMAVEKSSTELETLDRSKCSMVGSVSVSCGSGLELPQERTDTVCDNDVPTESQSTKQPIHLIPSTSTLVTERPRIAKTSTVLSDLSCAFHERLTSSVTSDVKMDISSMTGQKRAAARDPIPDPTGSGNNHHPSKRFRGGDCSTKEVIMSPCAIRQPPKSKRYGRKGRTSSPTRPGTDQVDFDELLPALTEFDVEMPKTRIVAMKGKVGKNMLAEKPVSGRPKAKQDRAIVQQAPIPAINKDHPFIGPKATRSPDRKLNVQVIWLCNPVDSESVSRCR
jgi:hypothetical protein